MPQDGDARSIVDQILGSGLGPEIQALIELEVGEQLDSSHPSLAGIEVECAVGSEPFAVDGAGGSYHVLADGRILLVSSEGSAGVIAASFKEFIGVTMALASWRDALKFVGLETLDAARAAWLAFVAKWGLDAQPDEPWLFDLGDFTTTTPAEARTLTLARFDAPRLVDPFGALYRAVTTLNGDVRVTCHGEPLSQFGK